MPAAHDGAARPGRAERGNTCFRSTSCTRDNSALLRSSAPPWCGKRSLGPDRTAPPPRQLRVAGGCFARRPMPTTTTLDGVLGRLQAAGATRLHLARRAASRHAAAGYARPELGERQHARCPAWRRAWTKTPRAESALALRGSSSEVGREPARAIPGRGWDPKSPRRDTTLLWNGAVPSRWSSTSASPTGC